MAPATRGWPLGRRLDDLAGHHVSLHRPSRLRCLAIRLRHIEVFQAVLEAGTLTGAANLLNISQPAATKLLQHAEQRLGYALFTRVRGRLQVTPEGLILKEKIEKISDDVRELQRLAANLKGTDSHPLRAVSTPTLAMAVVPKAVTRLRKSFQHASVELFTQHSREMLNSILLRETDIGLTLQELSHPGVHSQALCQSGLMVIAPKRWWSREELGKPISLEALAAAPVVGIAIRDTLGRQLQTHLEYLAPPPKISIWVQTYQLARSLVRNGHGLALVDPFTAFGDGDDSVQVRPLVQDMSVSLHAIYRLDHPLGPIQSAFLEHVREVSNELFAALAAKR